MGVKYVEFPILDTARKCGLSVDSRTIGHKEIDAKCPFCGDKPRRYHLRMNTEKNQYKCFYCGESGNSVSLYARVNGISNKDAAAELMRGNNVYILPREPVSKVKPEREPKSVEERHAVYSAMLGHLTLCDAHRENLRERGLSDDRSERNQYRSLPGNNKSRLLLASMLSDFYDLDGIPGFFVNRYGKWDISGAAGLLIPYRNSAGQIPGLQIRLDDAQKRKYRWLSSRDENRGTGSGSPIHVTGNLASKIAYITEGGLKGDVASFLDEDALFICIAGVSAIEGLRQIISSLDVQEVVVAMDMDKLTNPQVREAVAKINREVSKLRNVRVHAANWDMRYNGIDDYYLARGRTITQPLMLKAA
jgi:hypothetical protein